jgi:hypothetical protein
MKSQMTMFHRTVREERLFCAVLFHLLLSSRPNLQTFVDEINGQLPPERALGDIGDDAGIYVEFTFLRDSWNAIGGGAGPEKEAVNAEKRARIFDIFRRSAILAHLTADSLPAAPGAFNQMFMGTRGTLAKSDIVYPGQWSVEALADSFGTDPEVYRELCRIKWSFNIKPDLVVLAPDERAICVEAKLESGQGTYPASKKDCDIFDRVVSGTKDPGRVRQVELQQFMFETLLAMPCQPVVVGRTQFQKDPGIPFLTWEGLFSRLDRSHSLPFVERLIMENTIIDDK